MADYRPRLSVDLLPEQYRKIQKYFPHGTIKLVFRLVVNDLIEMMEEHGAGVVLGCFIERDITLKEVLRGNNPRLKHLDNEHGVPGRDRDSEEGSGEPQN